MTDLLYVRLYLKKIARSWIFINTVDIRSWWLFEFWVGRVGVYIRPAFRLTRVGRSWWLFEFPNFRVGRVFVYLRPAFFHRFGLKELADLRILYSVSSWIPTWTRSSASLSTRSAAAMRWNVSCATSRWRCLRTGLSSRRSRRPRGRPTLGRSSTLKWAFRLLFPIYLGTIDAFMVRPCKMTMKVFDQYIFWQGPSKRCKALTEWSPRIYTAEEVW